MAETLHGAVSYRDLPAVERLIAARAPLEGRNEVGATPLIVATSSDQYVIAERLVDAGADIWAYDQFGVTAGRMLDISKTPDASDEGQARLRVKEKLTARGFPFPAPDRTRVLSMVESGEWARLKQQGTVR